MAIVLIGADGIYSSLLQFKMKLFGLGMGFRDKGRY